MVEEKINVKISVVDLDPILPADEGEPVAKLKQESLQVTD
jgi:hypothetical protein